MTGRQLAPDAAERVAERIGPCRQGREHTDMLEAIERALLDYLEEEREPAARPSDARREIEVPHEQVCAASDAAREMTARAHLELAATAAAEGVEIDLERLHAVAEALRRVAPAAASATPRAKPQKKALQDLIGDLAVIVEDFGDWRAARTFDHHRADRHGRFHDVVRATLAGFIPEVLISDVALDGQIKRVLGSMDNFDPENP